MSSQFFEVDNYPWRWYENPERLCAGDERYSNLSLIKAPHRTDGVSKRDQIDALCNRCLSCPVYYDCLGDLLRFPKYDHWGIRAGKKGRSS